MAEGALKNRITQWLKGHPDTWFIKVHGSAYGRAGCPDIIICHKGRFIGAELKAGRNKPTKLQIHEMEQIEQAGGLAGVVRSIDDLEELMQ